jgi:Phage integrase family
MTDQPLPPAPNMNVPLPLPRSDRSWMRWLLIGGGCLGKEAATPDTASMTLIDNEGRKSEADPDKFGYISNDGNIFLENVTPGVTDKGHTIFTTQMGTPVNPENLVKRSFKPLLREANLPDVRFHDLRHTCATLLLGRHVHPKLVQELLGHATIAMTLDTYSHYLPSMGIRPQAR